MRVPHFLRLLCAIAMVTVWVGCHKEVQDIPLQNRLIGISDRFFDVQALDADHAVVVGYGGKILATSDGGYTWLQQPSGTGRALYRVRFVDANNGWVCGQTGLVLHTKDGGKTWERQNSGTNVYLFSIFFLDANRGWAVGDKSIYVQTADGGTTWTVHKIAPAAQADVSAAEMAASADPVLYDVQFVDSNVGWVVGEFGKIYQTKDSGQSWTEQEQSLLGDEIVDVLDLPTFFGVRFLDREHGWAAGLDGRIARTENGGGKWAFEKMKLDFPIVDPLFNVTVFPDGKGWAIGAAGEVVQLTDAGGEWQRAKLGMEVLTWLRGMNWLDENNGWIVGGHGGILHTKDGGQNWIPSLG
jgi:photosystem II stability/assembly factor-like uncharacterized protein